MSKRAIAHYPYPCEVFPPGILYDPKNLRKDPFACAALGYTLAKVSPSGFCIT
jgi:hypothetical protein